MFSIILISITTVMHLYLFGRSATVPFIRQHIPLGYVAGAGLLLWGLFYLGRTLRRSHSGVIVSSFEFLGMVWLGTLFLLCMVMLVVDMGTFFGLLFPRIAPVLRGWALIIGATLAVIALIQGVRPPVVREYQVPLAGLPPQMNGTRIVMLSDMHLGNQLGRRWLRHRVQQVRALKPDLVMLAGDIMDGHDGAMSRLIPDFRQFEAPLGVWAVLGNHEFYRGANSSTRLLERAGITVLRNQWAEVRPGLVLAGVDDLTTVRRLGAGSDPMTQALSGRPAGATILLSHTPWQAEQAAQSKVGLMLSGHTHDGQLWPFGYLVRRFYPLLYGAYDIQGMTAIVCRGTGTWGPRMRLWHPGEILQITLTAT